MSTSTRPRRWLVTGAIEPAGSLNVLVNNAGHPLIGVDEKSLAEISQIMAAIFFAPMCMTQTVLTPTAASNTGTP